MAIADVSLTRVVIDELMNRKTRKKCIMHGSFHVPYRIKSFDKVGSNKRVLNGSGYTFKERIEQSLPKIAFGLFRLVSAE